MFLSALRAQKPKKAEFAFARAHPNDCIIQKNNEWNTYDGDDDNFNRLRTQCAEDKIIIWDDTPQDFRLRWTIKDIELHSFYWCCEATHDGGQTWNLVEELHATRKLKSSSSQK